MIRIVTTKGADIIPEGVKRVVIGKQDGDLRLKWGRIENLSEQYAELIETAEGKWEIKVLDPAKKITVRGDILQRNTFIALANLEDLKNSGDLVEILGEVKFKLVQQEEETGLTT